MDSGNSRRGFLRELARTAREVKGVSGAGRDALAEAREALVRGEEPEEAAREETAPERPRDALAPEERERYAGQLALPDWSEEAQLALRGASVLVVGAGALGSHAALHLAAAGVGRLGIVDGDEVALGHLAHAPLHFTPDVGVGRAHSAAVKLGFLNPEVEVVPYQVPFEAGNAAGLLEGHDLVVDGTASPAVAAAARAAGLPLAAAVASGLGGRVIAVAGDSACPVCADLELGGDGAVLGPAAGAVGSLLALEALKLLTRFAPPVLDAVLEVDLAAPAMTRTPVARRPDCPACGRG